MGKRVDVEQEHVFMTADEEKYFKENQELKKEIEVLTLTNIQLKQTIAWMDEELDRVSDESDWRLTEL